MPVRVPIEPKLIAWARDRSGRSAESLHARFPLLESWERGDIWPTLKQLEDFARATYTPIGMLFLDEPPKVELPIPDLRTVRDQTVKDPSPNLIDTIAICEQRQEWYRSYVQEVGEDTVTFVNSLSTADAFSAAADQMRETFSFNEENRNQLGSWSEALGLLTESVESAGILVMISGIVGSNTHRKLDPDEFRGFALVDSYAPLVFINGADSRAAQIFTLAHELVHIGLGESAVSSPSLTVQEVNEVERWCNQVAAEFLVPRDSILENYTASAPLTSEIGRLARKYRVSTLVVLRRLFDVGLLGWDRFRAAYDEELNRISVARASGGGSFYNTLPVRVSKRFVRSVVESTYEGRTLHREAAQLLGFRNYSTLEELGHRLRVA